MKRLASVLLFLGIAVLVFGSVILYMEKAARQRANDVSIYAFYTCIYGYACGFYSDGGAGICQKRKNKHRCGSAHYQSDTG